MRGSGTDKRASATVAAGTTARAGLSLVARLAVDWPGGGRDAAVCHCDGWIGVGAVVSVVLVAAAVAAAVGARVVKARAAGGRPESSARARVK